MSAFPTDAKTLLGMIGTTPDNPTVEFLKFIKTLQVPEMSKDKDPDGTINVYWEYFEDGVEIVWQDDVLVKVGIYTRLDGDFAAYKYELFDGLANVASMDEVAFAMGEPARTGLFVGMPFWRYELKDKVIYFYFGEDEHVQYITVGYPVTP